MKPLLLILFLSCSQLSQGIIQKPPVFIQTYAGLAIPVFAGGLGFDAGFTYSPYWRVPTFIGFNYTKTYRNKQYSWPEVGDYRYRTTMQCLSPLMGVVIFYRRRVNCSVGIKYDLVTARGQLLTDNPILKGFLLDRYEHKKNSFSFFVSVHCRLNKHLLVFTRASMIRAEKITDLTGTLGLGLSYTIPAPTLSDKTEY